MRGFCDIAALAAQEAGKVILHYANRKAGVTIEEKMLYDYVSQADREAEACIIELLQKHYPGHSINAEESGYTHGEEAFQWLVDPLDGTTNFVFGIPHYAVSIALHKHGELQCAVVFDPCKQEMFCAIKGQGATLNGRSIQVRKRNSFAGALIATGVPFNGERLEKITQFTNTMETLLLHKSSGIRRLGSAALDLAYVAAGRYDAYWESGLQPWDIAAGALLVEEAGGIVSDVLGGNTFLDSGDIVAANPACYDTLVDVTRQQYSN